MRRILMMGLALAGLVYAVPANASWSGCWGELGIGVQVADNKLSADVGGTTFASIDGIGSQGGMIGLGIGCDYQIDRAVVGIFGRYDHNWSESEVQILGATLKMDYDRTVTIGGRLGWLVSDQTLVYMLAGYSWSGVNVSGLGINLSTDLTGLTLGGGVEVKLSGPWTLKAEYNWTAYDSASLFTSGPLDIRTEPDVHVFRAALSYRFGILAEAQATLK